MAEEKIEREDGEYFRIEDGSGVLLLESIGVVEEHESPNLVIGRTVRMVLRRG